MYQHDKSGSNEEAGWQANVIATKQEFFDSDLLGRPGATCGSVGVLAVWPAEPGLGSTSKVNNYE